MQLLAVAVATAPTTDVGRAGQRMVDGVSVTVLLRLQYMASKLSDFHSLFVLHCRLKLFG